MVPVTSHTPFVPQPHNQEKEFEGEARIIGGYDAQKGRYPYMVSLMSDFSHQCGGFLVAKDVVLTAAHCIENGFLNPNVQIKKAMLGRYDIFAASEANSQEIATSHQLMHSAYTMGTGEHDVGLIKLVTPSNFRPIKLNLEASSNLSPGLSLTTIGWGDIHGNHTYQGILQETSVNYITNQKCRSAPDPLRQESYTSYIYDDMMCAYTQGSDNCYGDSGGPLFKKGNGPLQDVPVGIVSWGIGCSRMPGVYARIGHPSNYKWIVSNICALSENPPPYLNCDETAIGVPEGGSSVRDDFDQFLEDIDLFLTPTAAPSDRPRTPRPTPATSPNTPRPTPAKYTVGVVLPPAFERPPTPPAPANTYGRSANTNNVESTSSSTATGRDTWLLWLVGSLSTVLVLLGFAY